MNSDFVSELIAGFVLMLHSGLCIFGRKVFTAYSIKQNEIMLARLQMNPLPARIAMCLFGTFVICLGIAEGVFDKAAVAKDSLWPALFIMSMGILCFVWAKYIVFVQTVSLRMCLHPLTGWVGNVSMILMGSISGPLGVAFLVGLFFLK